MGDAAECSALIKSFSVVSTTLAGCSAPGLSGTCVVEDGDFLRSERVVAIISLNESELDWSSLAPLAHLRFPVEESKRTKNHHLWINLRNTGGFAS